MSRSAASTRTVALLLILAAVKFFTVVMYFMHLKFDHKWFRRLFVTGLVLAVFCYIAYSRRCTSSQR